MVVDMEGIYCFDQTRQDGVKYIWKEREFIS
jgi:hypothetical protein